jgi:hypothetical protein
VANLALLQAGFLDAVVAGDEAKAPRIRGGKLSAGERLAVYRHNLFSNWRAALQDTYPVVERLVGPAFFGEAARRYALARPSASGDLHHFGEHFAEFLAHYPHARDLPYLGDVARLEWAWHASFHAADAPGIDLEALARVAPGDQGAIRFRLHPAVRLVDSVFPILAIWEANQPERDGTPDRLAGVDTVIVHRPGLEVQVGLLERTLWRFLRAIELGDPLEAAAERAGFGDAEELGMALRQFVAGRVITAFE